MSHSLRGNAMVGQSGGPTAAINATLSGVIRGAKIQMGEGGCIERLYGMYNGMEGLLEGRWIDLSERFNTEETFRLLEQTPAAALGSCRFKLPDPDDHNETSTLLYEKIFDIFRQNNIRYFFYIGGNDSMDTVWKLNRYAGRCGYEIRLIGVPKTVDNDLPLTDHAPGFGSAAKYVATVMQEIIRDCSVYRTRAVTVVECMGRDAGWLTAASALGRVVDGVEPDLVYLPECPFDMERFLARLEEKWKEKPALVVAVSEGLRLADGRYVGESQQSGAKDRFGHQYLAGTGRVLEAAVQERFGCKVRSVELNLPQRCAGHLLSRTDVDEAIRIGRDAVAAAVSGVSGEVMIYRRVSDTPYYCEIDHVDVMEIANQTRYVPTEYINETADHITDACCSYMLPLIQGECDLLYKSGLPRHLRL